MVSEEEFSRLIDNLSRPSEAGMTFQNCPEQDGDGLALIFPY